jgi:hypothetical protein
MYDVYAGKRKSLVFPIMCNAHVVIPYSENIVDIEGTPSDTSDDIPYGLWAHDDDFTIEWLITPYDINGLGTSGRIDRVAQNTKAGVMPANGAGNFISEAYLSTTNRLSHKMCIFKCAGFKVTLENTTSTNFNQPAEYKLNITYSTGSGVANNSTIIPIITASGSRSFEYDIVQLNHHRTGFNEDGRITHDEVGIVFPAMSSDSATIATGLTTYFYVGQDIYTKDGFNFTKIGTIDSMNAGGGNNITLDTTVSALPISTPLYADTYKEPKYIDNIHHLAISYSKNSNMINFYYGGKLIKSSLVSGYGSGNTLSFGREDIIIGKNTTGNNNASTDEQFMGEIHEMSVTSVYQKSFRYLNTLMPKFDDTLLYLRFEEGNE